jgi:predicted dehydrogenase
MIRVGLIGYGYWGPNLARNFSEAGGTDLVAVSELNGDRLRLAGARYPAVRITPDHQALFSDPEIDAVAIVTPVSTHFTLASQALAAGKHVFLEKPLTQTSEEGRKLVAQAERAGRILHVDHTFVYTSAVRRIKQIVESGELGDLYYFDSVRVNLGLIQADVNVIWDLAVHDLAILNYVFPFDPIAVSATGKQHVEGRPATIAYLTLFYESNAIAHVSVNWLSPVKVRRTLIGGSRKMIVYDDLEPSEKIKVYDRGVALGETKENIYETMVSYRTGDMYAPHLDATEALRAEVDHFARCIEGKEKQITGGAAGLRVVRILEAATQSMDQRGRPVDLAR